MTRQYGSPTNFTAEAKNYDREVWNSLSSQQKRQVSDLKGAAGWINGYTPPAGFVIDTNGYATPSTHVISAMQQIQHVPLPQPPQNSSTGCFVVWKLELDQVPPQCSISEQTRDPA